MPRKTILYPPEIMAPRYSLDRQTRHNREPERGASSTVIPVPLSFRFSLFFPLGRACAESGPRLAAIWVRGVNGSETGYVSLAGYSEYTKWFERRRL